MSGQVPDEPYAPPAAEVWQPPPKQAPRAGEVQRFANRLAVGYLALPLLMLLSGTIVVFPVGELVFVVIGALLLLLWLLNVVMLIVVGAALELQRGQPLRAGLVAILGLLSGGSLTLVYLLVRRLSPRGPGAEERTQGP
jgi:hypothetical protein